MRQSPKASGKHVASSDMLPFMDATGLRPSEAYRRVFPPHGLMWHPYFDHTLIWRDGGGYIVTTEPYGECAHNDPEGTAFWAREHGWQCVAAPEWGMWRPPETHLWILSPPRIGADVEEVIRRLRFNTRA